MYSKKKNRLPPRLVPRANLAHRGVVRQNINKKFKNKKLFQKFSLRCIAKYLKTLVFVNCCTQLDATLTGAAKPRRPRATACSSTAIRTSAASRRRGPKNVEQCFLRNSGDLRIVKFSIFVTKFMFCKECDRLRNLRVARYTPKDSDCATQCESFFQMKTTDMQDFGRKCGPYFEFSTLDCTKVTDQQGCGFYKGYTKFQLAKFSFW